MTKKGLKNKPDFGKIYSYKGGTTMETAANWFYAFLVSIVRTCVRPLLREGSSLPKAGLLTIPNAVSFTRIPIGAAVMILGTEGGWTSFGLLIAAAFTDLLDGFLARDHNSATKSGAMIDPICDKIFFFLCVCTYRTIFNPVIFWTLVVIEVFIFIVPIVAIKVFRSQLSEADVKSTIHGKAKFAFECVSLIAAILGAQLLANLLLLLAIPLDVLSIWKKIKTAQKAVKGNSLD